MSFQKIKFYNFRNLANDEINIDAPVIFLIGKNGQGKTNFIEAIYYSCYGSSFRIKRDKYVINKNTDMCFISAISGTNNELKKTIYIKLTTNKKEIRVDSKKILDRKALLENIPCIVFAYEDMAYVNGSPEKKRWFFNQTICLFDILYIDILRKYKKILMNRNLSLKRKNIDVAKIYNKELANLGLEIQEKRYKLINELNDILIPLYKDISDTDNELRIAYKPSWKAFSKTEEIVGYLDNNMKKDLMYMMTTTGPHRDNFYYLLDGDDFSKFSSTGQIRTAAIILKIAQAKFFFEKRGKKPILLLDDVLLEMDYLKRKRAILNLPEYEQAFFTFLPNENFLGYTIKDQLIYYIENGIVKEWKKQAI